MWWEDEIKEIREELKRKKDYVSAHALRAYRKRLRYLKHINDTYNQRMKERRQLKLI